MSLFRQVVENGKFRIDGWRKVLQADRKHFFLCSLLTLYYFFLLCVIMCPRLCWITERWAILPLFTPWTVRKSATLKYQEAINIAEGILHYANAIRKKKMNKNTCFPPEALHWFGLLPTKLHSFVGVVGQLSSLHSYCACHRTLSLPWRHHHDPVTAIGLQTQMFPHMTGTWSELHLWTVEAVQACFVHRQVQMEMKKNPHISQSLA